jgi:hypothetical protein
MDQHGNHVLARSPQLTSCFPTPLSSGEGKGIKDVFQPLSRQVKEKESK